MRAHHWLRAVDDAPAALGGHDWRRLFDAISGRCPWAACRTAAQRSRVSRSAGSQSAGALHMMPPGLTSAGGRSSWPRGAASPFRRGARCRDHERQCEQRLCSSGAWRSMSTSNLSRKGVPPLPHHRSPHIRLYLSYTRVDACVKSAASVLQRRANLGVDAIKPWVDLLKPPSTTFLCCPLRLFEHAMFEVECSASPAGPALSPAASPPAKSQRLFVWSCI